MRLQGRVRKWLASVVSAAALLLVLPGPATADGSRRLVGNQLNLHQCVYLPFPGVNYLTTLVPSRDGRFTTGTATSATADGNRSCGPGDGNFEPLHPLASVQSLDLSTGRYLNLHQCVYYSAAQRDHITTVIARGGSDFSTGTNISNTPDTAPECAAGRGLYYLVPLLSDVKALDLSAGRYINLQQCMYYYGAGGFDNHFTTFVPARGDGRYNTGTKVSNTADTAPTCGGGNGNYRVVPLLSGTLALSRT
ncbi:hypothetical protein [Streptomyces sp. NPDC090131]|uniref:hypothetical protein n=1 Tax=Streptomyces sp. NPDC090131 TaxID=3365954 RepID=UPI00382D222E